jgi:hypothetical protein
MKWIGKLYDGAGNEISLKPGHSFVFGKDSFCQIPDEKYDNELVYKLANGEPLQAEFGTSFCIDWIRHPEKYPERKSDGH